MFYKKKTPSTTGINRNCGLPREYQRAGVKRYYDETELFTLKPLSIKRTNFYVISFYYHERIQKASRPTD